MSDESILEFDKLLGEGPFKTFNRTLQAPEAVVRGQALGFITANKTVTSFDAGGAGGAEVFYGIAVEDSDAAAGDAPISVYVGGEFLINGLIFSETGDTADIDFVNAARDIGIILKTATDVTGS